MTRDRGLYARAATLLARGLEIEPGARRRFLLDETADDPPLRCEVFSLLEHHSTAAGLPPLDLGSWWLDDEASDAPDSTLDLGPSYAVRRLIATGGMGSVYEVDQLQPLKRRVAVKVIRPGIGSDHVVKRFEAEKRVLAALDHPGIAKVFDAGRTTDGRQFFAMEFIDGQPITRYCEEHGLGVAERVTLLARVAEAAHYAHQRGVLHRDIKPSNILAYSTSQGPAARIIDFGICKTLSDDLAIDRTATLAGVPIGTPEYMAPEQALGGSGPANVAADVYALGAVLFELLTGEPPIQFAGEQLKLLDIIRELDRHEPGRPSERVARRSVQRLTAGESRIVRQGLSVRTLRGDLDAIVLKAMSREPARRYESAGALADDLHRYLVGKPVAAQPPSPGYQLRKWVRKRPAVAASVALAGVSVLLGLSVSLWQWNMAQRERDAARQHLGRLQHSSMRLLREMSSLIDLPGTAASRAAFASLISDNLEILRPASEGAAEGRWLLAEAQEALSQIQWNPNGPSLGDTESALQNMLAANSIFRELHLAHPHETRYAVRLLESNSLLMLVQGGLGQIDEPTAVLHQSISLAESLLVAGYSGAQVPILLAEARFALGNLCRHHGETGVAAQHDSAGFVALMSLPSPSVNDTAALAQARLSLLPSRAMTDTAWHARMVRDGVKYTGEYLAKKPFSTQAIMMVARAYRNSGDWHGANRRPLEAVRALEVSSRHMERLHLADTLDVMAKSDLALILTREGVARFDAGQVDSALAVLDRAEGLLVEIDRSRLRPNWIDHLLHLHRARHADVLAATGRLTEARERMKSIERKWGDPSPASDSMQRMRRWRWRETWAHMELRHGEPERSIIQHRGAALEMRAVAGYLSGREAPGLEPIQDAIAGMIHCARHLGGHPETRGLADTLLSEAGNLAMSRLPSGNSLRRMIESMDRSDWLRRQVPGDLVFDSDSRGFDQLYRLNPRENPVWGLVPTPPEAVTQGSARRILTNVSP